MWMPIVPEAWEGLRAAAVGDEVVEVVQIGLIYERVHRRYGWGGIFGGVTDLGLEFTGAVDRVNESIYEYKAQQCFGISILRPSIQRYKMEDW